jgi:hypothetical protein
MREINHLQRVGPSRALKDLCPSPGGEGWGEGVRSFSQPQLFRSGIKRHKAAHPQRSAEHCSATLSGTPQQIVFLNTTTTIRRTNSSPHFCVEKKIYPVPGGTKRYHPARSVTTNRSPVLRPVRRSQAEADRPRSRSSFPSFATVRIFFRYAGLRGNIRD